MSETIQSQLYPFHSDGLAAVLANHEHLNVSGVCNLLVEDLTCLSKHLENALEDCACVLGGIQALIEVNRHAPESVRLDEQHISGLLAAVNHAVAAPMLPLSGILSALSFDLGFRDGYRRAVDDSSDGEVQP